MEGGAGPELEGSSDETEVVKSWLLLTSLSENAFHSLSRGGQFIHRCGSGFVFIER